MAGPAPAPRPVATGRGAVWRPATLDRITRILRNPAYAGAFVYGRTRSRPTPYCNGKRGSVPRPMAEWKIVVKDKYPAYIDWESFERIQAMLCYNHAEYDRNKTRGAPRDGAVLLQGLVWCGHCGRKMVVQYKSKNSYLCNHLNRLQG